MSEATQLETVDQWVLQAPNGKFALRVSPAAASGHATSGLTGDPEKAHAWGALGEASRAAYVWTDSLAACGGVGRFQVLHRTVTVIRPAFQPVSQPADDSLDEF